MITKSRLEQLIEQGATIYSTCCNEEIDLSQQCEIIDSLNKNGHILFIYEDKDHKLTYFLNNLTEDVEQAKWQLEFGNIIRTETLRLPSWEEFKSQDKRIHFSDPMHRYSYYGYTDLRRIEIKEYYGQNGNVIFSKPSTEPNYIEACRLCKKLFLGE